MLGHSGTRVYRSSPGAPTAAHGCARRRAPRQYICYTYNNKVTIEPRPRTLRVGAHHCYRTCRHRTTAAPCAVLLLPPAGAPCAPASSPPTAAHECARRRAAPNTHSLRPLPCIFPPPPALTFAIRCRLWADCRSASDSTFCNIEQQNFASERLIAVCSTKVTNFTRVFVHFDYCLKSAIAL